MNEFVNHFNQFIENNPTVSNDHVIEFCQRTETPVVIGRNNELGYFVYAVVIGGTDYWLNNFTFENEAKQWCRNNFLNLLEEELV